MFGFCIIALVEIGLQAARFHAPACDSDPFVSFKENVPVLVDANYQGQKVLTINPRLGSYFNPIAFPKEKSANTKRIFVLGGSDVMGFPFGDQGAFSKFLSLGLNQLDPAHHYQVISLAAFGYASYRVARVLKDALNYQPDLIIIMTGHNEFLEKREYGSAPKFFWLQSKLSRLKIYCLLKTALFKIHPAPKKPLISTDVKWEHFTMDQKMRAKIIDHYKFNISEMNRLAKKRKTPVLFLTLPVNLKDFPPFHSDHKTNIAASELAEWQKLDAESQELIAQKNFSEAIPVLEKEAGIDPEYALTWFETAQASLAEGATNLAKSSFKAALEKDAWQVRALPEFNDFLRRLPGKPEVLDLEPVFDAASKDGIPGDNLFYDHCHPRLETHALIAKEIIKKGNAQGMLQIPAGWESDYDQITKNYIDALPQSFLSQGYYALAVEIGINMGLKDLGKKYLNLALSLDPQNPKLKNLAERLK